MALSPGSRLGAYEIVAAIGAGGMGEVYRATDSNLKRAVAIKVLPASVAGDADRLARFQREAEVLAALNHPNIAAIYGLEKTPDFTALVMELVEGDDLSQRIARGAIPIDEALPIAKQIAEALAAAHEQGIIHRDLKPANIKVRPDGTVKVLDFGLAKAMEPAYAQGASAGQALSQSPTITTPAMTQAGMILGTAAYMSPEQARGKPVDRRADIWAFGAVLFEMLTRRRPFDGEDTAEVLGAVVRLDAPWDALPSAVPPAVRTLLQSCLEKDPRRRVGDISTALFVLDKAASLAAPALIPRTSMAAARTSASGGRRGWMAAFGVAVLMLALAVPAVQHLREAPPSLPPEMRVEISTPPTEEPTMFALSPDGRQIAFVASGEGASRLWLRSLATTTAQPLAGTEGARYPFWSPDGRSIGFFSGSSLKRLDIAGGTPQTLAPVVNGSGGTWNADGVIVFAPSLTAVLMRVPATGGSATTVTTLGPQQSGHWAPFFLPDGRRFLFAVLGGSATSGIYLGALDGSSPTQLTRADGSGIYLPGGSGPARAIRDSGWLLWPQEGTLVARQLDLAKAALIGDPVKLADGTADRRLRMPGMSAVSAAATGLVAYRTAADTERQLTWVDRSGNARGTVGDPDRTFFAPRVSPDGRRVAVSRGVLGSMHLWLLDGGRANRFTFDAGDNYFPVWSPDGTRIAYVSRRTGRGDIYQKRTDGTGVEEPLLTSDQFKAPDSWSADGRFLLFDNLDPRTGWDILVTATAGERRASAFLQTSSYEAWSVFSPDGRWVAYQSNESGRMEIYVRPFLGGATRTATGASGVQWQLSTAGGIMPAWRRDGKELYFLSPAGDMMAVPVTVTGTSLDPGAPVMLFPTRIVGGGVDAQQGRQYDVAPDGRFLINTERATATAPITLLMNWSPPGKK